MTPSKIVRIPLRGDIKSPQAEGVAARIRAALSNGIIHFELICDRDTNLVSAELLGYLAVVAQSIRSKDGWIAVSRQAPSLCSLLDVLKMDAVFRWIHETSDERVSEPREGDDGKNTDR